MWLPVEVLASLGGHGGKRVVGEPTRQPVSPDFRIDAFVKLDRWGVPVQHLPINPSEPSVNSKRRKFSKQGPAISGTSMCGLYVQILEIDAWQSAPRGIALKEERHAEQAYLRLRQ
ncbi:hypothetical protein GQR58_028481 [Nymphon striatum]|nr:hypothetical protein GQR58_028481 [Nymphon striatum]